jgi:signal transduction histidine kinase
LAKLRLLTRGALAEMRTLLLELRPSAIVETELETLLSHLGRAVLARAGVQVEMSLSQVQLAEADVKLALYRITQEALNNVVKHANATTVTLSLHAHESVAGVDGVEIHVCDNGRGFDASSIPAGHFGLVNMRERAAAVAAELQVESAPGRGTCISVVWRTPKDS